MHVTLFIYENGLQLLSVTVIRVVTIGYVFKRNKKVISGFDEYQYNYSYHSKPYEKKVDFIPRTYNLVNEKTFFISGFFLSFTSYFLGYNLSKGSILIITW